MDTWPTVAICGRPNVGKSTLFNALAGKRISIVDPTSGVTRDRVSTIAHIREKYFELVDTGGIGIVDNMDLSDAIEYQIQVALEKASLILFMVDIKSGVTPLDKKIATLLRKYSEKKVFLIANKVDFPELKLEKDPFFKLGFGDPFCISATSFSGVGELKDEIAKNVELCPEKPPEQAQIKIAVVGQPNAGKSTFINCLAKEERVIVSEIPGTTRDSVDVRFEKDGKVVIAIDTAGLKRKKNVDGNIDFYSQTRAQKAIRRADIAVLMLDATKKISRIDKEIADFIVDEHKASIIVINKWDLVPDGITTSKYETYISKLMPGLLHAPLCFITAKTGKNIPSTIDLARNLYKQSKREVSTGKLNKLLAEIVKKKSPYRKGRQGRIYYGTQVGTIPPSFLLFVNDPILFSPSYKRYLFNQFQEKLGFPEIPVKIDFRGKKKKELKEG